jgi:hypothetical protein
MQGPNRLGPIDRTGSYSYREYRALIKPKKNRYKSGFIVKKTLSVTEQKDKV